MNVSDRVTARRGLRRGAGRLQSGAELHLPPGRFRLNNSRIEAVRVFDRIQFASELERPRRQHASTVHCHREAVEVSDREPQRDPSIRRLVPVARFYPHFGLSIGVGLAVLSPVKHQRSRAHEHGCGRDDRAVERYIHGFPLRVHQSTPMWAPEGVAA